MKNLVDQSTIRIRDFGFQASQSAMQLNYRVNREQYSGLISFESTGDSRDTLTIVREECNVSILFQNNLQGTTKGEFQDYFNVNWESQLE